LQTCFFAISGLLPRDEAIRHIKESVRQDVFTQKATRLCGRTTPAVDATLVNLFEVRVPAGVTSTFDRSAIVPEDAPQFVREVTAKMMAGLGDEIPVSLLPVDGNLSVGHKRVREAQCRR